MGVLKPRDIANVQFRTAWRGYNEEDVDEFVQKIVSAYETLYHEYQRLQDQTDKLQLRLDEYSQSEVQIEETLAFAKQAARDAKQAAEQQAEAIVAKAQVDADQLMRQARRRVEEYAARALDVARQEAGFRARLGELLDAYKALLAEGRHDAEQLTRAVASLTDEAAAALDADADYEASEDSVSMHSDVEHGWAADSEAVDDWDLEPTRRMDAVRSPRTEER